MLDITMTPDSEFTTLGKGGWLMVAGVFWIFGATAWLLVGRPQRPLHRSVRYRPADYGPADALLRHPAAQAAVAYVEQPGWPSGAGSLRPRGPDDDEDFLRELDRRIREAREDG